MYEQLKSRKLWAFIGIVVLVLSNYIFKLGMPNDSVMYLVILAASYILGQGYVDAQKQPTTNFPVDDFTNSVTNIIQSEIAKTGFGKNLPMESIIEMVRVVMKQEIGKLSVALVPVEDPVDFAPPVQEPVIATVDEPQPVVDPVQ